MHPENKSRRILYAAIILSLLGGAFPSLLGVALGAQPPGGEASLGKASALYREGEVLVKFRKGIGSQEAHGIAASKSLMAVRRFDLLSRQRGQECLLLQSARLSTEEMLADLRRDPRVETVSPNFIRRADLLPNDTSFNQLWGLDNQGQTVNGVVGIPDEDIDAPEAWYTSQGSETVVVANLDTGVDYTHQDLAANMWVNRNETPADGIDNDLNGRVDDVWGLDTVNNDSDPMDDNGHGTHIAGTMAAVGDNAHGVTGVSWRAKIMALKFLDANGSGADADAIECIEYAIGMKLYYGVNIVAINASWGGYGGVDGDLLSEAIEAAGQAGIVFCASAGNDHNNNDGYNPQYPASYNLPNIVSVAATDANGLLAVTSNYGATAVDLAAPGENIYSTIPGGNYQPQAGDIFFDDVESGSHFTSGGIQNYWGITTEDSHSPSHSWSDSPGSEYANNTDSYLVVDHDLDLSAVPDPWIYLGFWADVDLEEGYDYLNADISADGGATWMTVASFTGTGLGWNLHTYLIPEAYRTARFRFRFRLVSDAWGTDGGVHLDDIGVGVSNGSDAYAFWSGTSMAAPYVTGAVALLAAAHPAEDSFTRIGRILSGVDPLDSLRGKVVTGGRLNLANSIVPGLVLKPFILGASPAEGLASGSRTVISGRAFGSSAGRVVLDPGFRSNQFLFRFRLQTNRTIRRNGVYLDDVRLGTQTTVYFTDDMESGSGKWVTSGVNNMWSVSAESSWSGGFAWTDSPGVNYANNTDAVLQASGALDVSGANGQPLALSFWADINLENKLDTLSLEISADGGAGWHPIATLTGTRGWALYQFVIPDDSAETDAVVSSWSDLAITADMPAGVTGNRLAIIRADAVPSVNAASVRAWQAKEASLGYHAYAAAVHTQGRIFVFGGNTIQNTPTDMVEVYNPRTDRWETSSWTRMPLPRSEHTAAAAGGRVYLIGGLDQAGNSLDIVDSYDPVTKSWRREPSLPVALTWARAVSLNGKVYVTGGSEDGLWTLDSLYMLSPSAGAWQQLAPMIQARDAHGAAVHGGKIYVFGGTDDHGRPLLSTEVYDPATDSWTPGGDMPALLTDAEAAGDGDAVYLLGSGGFLKYLPATGHWEGLKDTRHDLPKTDAPLVYVPMYGLYAVNGQGAAGWTNDLLRLDLQQVFTQVDVLSPDGGEVIPSGATCTIQWVAPPSAVRFKVLYWLGPGTRWRRVVRSDAGYLYDWAVPRVNGNRPACKVKVVGYNAAGALVGAGISAASFAIEVLRLTAPDGGEALHPGDRFTITWRTNPSASRVARVSLLLTKNGGTTWRRIRTLNGNPGSFVWTVPTANTARCRIKVVLLDSLGQVVAADASNAFFSIAP